VKAIYYLPLLIIDEMDVSGYGVSPVRYRPASGPALVFPDKKRSPFFNLSDVLKRVNSLRKNSIFTGGSKRSRYQAPEIWRNEAYIEIRWNNER
jgi:hypothetical protein